MTQTSFEGSCLCGAIRCRSTKPSIRCLICHCEYCRKHSGGPCLSFVHFPVEAFTWIGGQPQRYRSSQYAERGFCPGCGSTVSMHEEVLPDRVQVTLGGLDNPGSVKPDDHVWIQSQIPWLDVCDDLVRFPRSSAAVISKAEEQ